MIRKATPLAGISITKELVVYVPRHYVQCLAERITCPSTTFTTPVVAELPAVKPYIPVPGIGFPSL